MYLFEGIVFVNLGKDHVFVRKSRQKTGAMTCNFFLTEWKLFFTGKWKLPTSFELNESYISQHKRFATATLNSNKNIVFFHLTGSKNSRNENHINHWKQGRNRNSNFCAKMPSNYCSFIFLYCVPDNNKSWSSPLKIP